MTKTLILTLSKSQYVKKLKEEGRRKKHPHSILQAIILKITQDYTSEYEKPFFAGHVRRFTPNVRRFHIKGRTNCPTQYYHEKIELKFLSKLYFTYSDRLLSQDYKTDSNFYLFWPKAEICMCIFPNVACWTWHKWKAFVFLFVFFTYFYNKKLWSWCLTKKCPALNENVRQKDQKHRTWCPPLPKVFHIHCYTFKYSLETMGKVASLKIKIN